MSYPTPRTAAALALCAGLLTATGCSATPAPESGDIDLGSGPPQAGTVKKDALKDVTLTFVSYGGIYQKGQETTAVKPFEAESGAKILSDGPTDYAKIQAQVESKNVTWDVVDTGSTFAIANCGKLFMPLDTSIIDTSHMPQELVSECAVPAMTYGYVMVYNTAKYGPNGPKSWQDFFDIAKYPGKRAINGTPSDIEPGILEGALIADGVPRDQLYPLDVPRALRKLDTIKGNLMYWETGAEAQQQIESGQPDISFMWSGRALAGIKNGATYAANWTDFSPVFDTLTVPMDAKNPKASMALINFMVGPEQQAKLAEATSYAPIHDQAKPNIDAQTRSFLATEHQQQALPIDNKWWGENQPQVIEQWSNWLGN